MLMIVTGLSLSLTALFVLPQYFIHQVSVKNELLRVWEEDSCRRKQEENRSYRFLIHIWFDSIIMTLAHGNPELLESKLFLRLRSQHSYKVNASERFSSLAPEGQKCRAMRLNSNQISK